MQVMTLCSPVKYDSHNNRLRSLLTPIKTTSIKIKKNCNCFITTKEIYTCNFLPAVKSASLIEFVPIFTHLNLHEVAKWL